jgi:hypothetical protein
MFDELSLHILDIGMNSLAAGATVVRITVIENLERDWLILRVLDNGRGMHARTLRRVMTGSFSTKLGRKKPIGLGLALLRQVSESCGGTFHVHSHPGKGTGVTASMRWSHVDRPPLGDLETTLRALRLANPDADVQLQYRKKGSTHEPRRTQKTQRESAAASRAA